MSDSQTKGAAAFTKQVAAFGRELDQHLAAIRLLGDPDARVVAEFSNPFLHDKLRWGDGPWQHEPDKVQWADPSTGYPCLAVRSPTSGAWCGYVGLPPEHPLYGQTPDDPGVRSLPIHGGIDYAAACDEPSGDVSAAEIERAFVCHAPESGQPDRVWWLGFHTAHSGDLWPSYRPILGEERFQRLFGEYPGLPAPTYKDLKWLYRRVAALAEHLAGLAGAWCCSFCNRLTHHPTDVEMRYCSCCGSADGLLLKDCEHRPVASEAPS